MKKILIIITIVFSLVLYSVSAEEGAVRFEVVPTADNGYVAISVEYKNNSERNKV